MIEGLQDELLDCMLKAVTQQNVKKVKRCECFPDALYVALPPENESTPSETRFLRLLHLAAALAFSLCQVMSLVNKNQDYNPSQQG